MKYKRIELPYSYNVLEPIVDALTMETHYEKHHKGYESKFNESIKGTTLENYDSIENLMLDFNNIDESLKTITRNAGGGLINHNFYFNQFSNEYEINIDEIIKEFNSLDNFKEQMISKGMAVFGSGWVWLIKNNNKLEIITTPNQDNPWMLGIEEVIIGIDLWEHAYYLKYKQDRKSYIQNLLEFIL